MSLSSPVSLLGAGGNFAVIGASSAGAWSAASNQWSPLSRSSLTQLAGS